MTKPKSVDNALGVWTRDNVRTTLEEVIAEIQEMGGHNLPEFNDDLCIMLDVEGFDSLIRIESLTLLSERFGVEMPDDLMYNRVTCQPSNFGEIVNRSCQVLGIQ